MPGAAPPALPARQYGLGAKLLAAAVAFLLAFLMLEAGLRVVASVLPDARTRGAARDAIEALPGSERVYGLRPSLGAPFATNSLGFRGPEVAREKPGGVYRIAMLGDSITYGNSVASEETFSHRLQGLLNDGRDRPTVEVLNLGVSGYNTRQELATLLEVGLPLEPDLVVLNVCLNDSDPVKRIVRAGLGNRATIAGWSDLNLRNLIAASYVLTFFKDNLVRLFRDQRVLTRLNSPAVFLDSRVGEKAWGAMKRDMERVVETARRQGVPVLAVIYPYRSQIDLAPEQRVPQRDLLRFFDEIGVPALDVAPYYRDLGPAMFVDDYIHLSPEGHSVVARVLREFLAEAVPTRATGGPGQLPAGPGG